MFTKLPQRVVKVKLLYMFYSDFPGQLSALPIFINIFS